MAIKEDDNSNKRGCTSWVEAISPIIHYASPTEDLTNRYV